MNKNGFIYGVSEKCFRPQQGLTIMNELAHVAITTVKFEGFPSPTGVNYYEWLKEFYDKADVFKNKVSVPNRG